MGWSGHGKPVFRRWNWIIGALLTGPVSEAVLIELLTAIRRILVIGGFHAGATAGFTEHYRGRLLNIHPSLLPKFRGLHTHERAIAAGETEHGATIHFVTAELDGGPLIVQARVPVLPDDDPDHLAARVLEQEHRSDPAIRWLAEGRLKLDGERVWVRWRTAAGAAAAGGFCLNPGAVPIPGDEAGDAFFHRRRWLVADIGNQRLNIGKGVRYITGLHRQQIFDRGATQALFQHFDIAQQFDRAVTADVV